MHLTKNPKCQPHGGALEKVKGITKISRVHPLWTNGSLYKTLWQFITVDNC